MKQRTIDKLIECLISGEPKQIPEGAEAVWEVYNRLSRARSFGQAGPNPISFSDIQAFIQVTRTPLSPKHVWAIERLDHAFLEDVYARHERPDGVETLPPVSKEALTPALFDLGF